MRRLIILGVAAGGLLVAGNGCQDDEARLAPEHMRYFKETAGATVAALFRYRFDHGWRFPARLGDLVPEYLPAVPKPPAESTEWRYYTEDGANEFFLTFRPGNGHWLFWYSSKGSSWSCDNSAYEAQSRPVSWTGDGAYRFGGGAKKS
jgi:hypothetical protein